MENKLSWETLRHIYAKQYEKYETALYQKVFRKYLVLKVRMKISYMAFMEGKTVKELFLHAILKSYHELTVAGLIDAPPDDPFDRML